MLGDTLDRLITRDPPLVVASARSGSARRATCICCRDRFRSKACPRIVARNTRARMIAMANSARVEALEHTVAGLQARLEHVRHTTPSRSVARHPAQAGISSPQYLQEIPWLG
jgi:uncharacterized protein YceH (UPF0502 family)